ncbi:MAG: tRNA pseudouridine(38-40) synthase TruA [Archangium sp.]|nr:tRNA pseudouridine(38-40) synthase TruA [Archangium sp.]
MSGPFRIVALWCWYRGAGFHGYQRQGDLRTVQGELLRAFARAGLSRNPVVAGRTDKGVSARMQVLSGRVSREVEVDSLPARLNAFLPPDLGIHLARERAPGFHAAWSAEAKEYRYVVSRENAGDLERLRSAAALIPGTRNFKVFHFKTSAEQLRTVTSVEVLNEGSTVTLRFVGEGFARHMVRMLVAAITAVARGELDLEVMNAGLTLQRNFHCPIAAPEPLTLWSVGYSEASDPFTAAERADFRWPRTDVDR